MIERNIESRAGKENEYKGLLIVRKVDTSMDRTYSWRFSVSENFNIFITAAMHERLFESWGVDPDRTLTEGYISFNETGTVKEVRFKPSFYQPIPGFKGSPEELKKLQAATRELIEESLNDDVK